MCLSFLHRTHKKDRINELGSVRFAKETNQHLYSVDKWVIYEDIPKKVAGCKRRKRGKATESSTNIQNDQEKLWELPHHVTQHFPGKLSLCIGMPVMLQNNDATELCITKERRDSCGLAILCWASWKIST